MTTTRLIVEYSGLEQKLDDAIQHRDAAALGGMLADDFEEWTPATPGGPIAREDWMKHALDPSIAVQSSQIRQMAVRTVDHTDVVSFVEIRRASCGGRDCSSNAFIVDVWREAGNPTLLIRYRSEIGKRELAPAPAKPTGRE